MDKDTYKAWAPTSYKWDDGAPMRWALFTGVITYNPTSKELIFTKHTSCGSQFPANEKFLSFIIYAAIKQDDYCTGITLNASECKTNSLHTM